MPLQVEEMDRGRPTPPRRQGPPERQRARVRPARMLAEPAPDVEHEIEFVSQRSHRLRHRREYNALPDSPIRSKEMTAPSDATSRKSTTVQQEGTPRQAAP